MEKTLYNKIKHLVINEEASITEAFKLMDRIDKKLLLIVNSNQEYKSVVSVGDIQRHLIKTQDFKASVFQVVRPNIRVAEVSQSIAEIKSEMLKFRMEFMPVLNSEKQLVDVVFWDDLFKETQVLNKSNLDIPVVIMAGGKGERLKPITNIIPKPLIPIGEQTIMERIINRFVVCGVDKFYASVSYKAEMIKNHFQNLENKKYEIDYFEEDKPLGTAGSLSLLKNKITSTFFVSNCDILISQDYEAVYDYHIENKNELTLIGALKNYSIPYGTLEVSENGLLSKIEEKPELDFMVNTGMYIVEPHLLDEIPENTFFHITDLMQKIIKRGGRVGVFPIGESSWFDIGNWAEYNETLKKFGETPIN
tara:strand:- start:1699 stop:2790 length:1092 start_codon:yes stop_codon:yes gene_type:complete